MKEGTEDTSGKGQIISNINACQAVVDVVKTTLGKCHGPQLHTSCPNDNLAPPNRNPFALTTVRKLERGFFV